MGKEAEYFAENRIPPKWFIGDRVYGKWNKIPFVGTVLIDHIVTEEVGPVVQVYLDLPLKYNQEYKKILEVKQKDIKKLSQI